jgi:ferritin-like metal-binding protein YciE
MASIDSLLTLLLEELRELNDIEQRLTNAIPRLAEGASDRQLVEVLQQLSVDTDTHAARLEQAFAALEERTDTKSSAGVYALIRTATEQNDARYAHKTIRDAALVGATRRIQHFQIAVYSTAVAHAKALSEDEVAALLQANLYEDKQANRALIVVGKRLVGRKSQKKIATALHA